LPNPVPVAPTLPLPAEATGSVSPDGGRNH
jgi:hypothetical protein